MMKNFRKCIKVLLFLSVLSLLLYPLAAFVANSLGCDFGGPCLCLNYDISGILAYGYMMMFVFIIAMPFTIGLILLWIVVETVNYVVTASKKKIKAKT